MSRPFQLSAMLIPFLFVTLHAEPARAISGSFSGKTFGTYWERGVNLNAGTFSASIVKGKKKHMLVIEVSASNLIGHALCFDSVKVNGVFAKPGTSSFNGICEGTNSGLTEDEEHALSAVYLLDLDDAETSSPGLFHGQPLTITVDPSTDTGSAAAGTITIVARMEKK